MTEKALDHKHDVQLKSVDRLNPTRVKLNLEFSQDTLQNHEESALEGFVRGAKIPGFRPGKAPVAMVRERYRTEIRQDVISHLLKAGLQEALEISKLNPVSTPEVRLSEIVEGKPLAFSVEFDIEPEFELKGHQGIPLKKRSTEPTDQEMEETLNTLRNRMATLEPLTAEKPEKGNFAVVDVGFTLKDLPEKKQEKQTYTVELGNGSVLSEIEKAIMKLKVGESCEVEDTFPAGYAEKSVEGKTALFQVTLVELKQKVLPELNDAFAAGFKEGATLDSLRTDIKQNIQRSKEEEAKKAQREEILDHLIAENKFDLPESLVQDQLQGLMDWIEDDFKNRGIKAPKPTPEDMKSLRSRAERMVKTRLILKGLARKENINLDEARLQGRIESIAKEIGKEVSEVEKLLKAARSEQRLRDDVFTDQLFEFLVGHAKPAK